MKVILEPVPVLKEASPSSVRSMYQLRFVPDPIAVTVWPGARVVPCAGEVMAIVAGVTVRLKLVVFVTPPPAPVTDTV